MISSDQMKRIAESLASSKEAREEFVRSQIEDGIPFQIRANRKVRGWNQTKLGDECGMLQTALSRIESGSAGLQNIETLLRIVNAFDLALIVKIVSFGELLEWGIGSREPQISRPSFCNDEKISDLLSVQPSMGEIGSECKSVAIGSVSEITVEHASANPVDIESYKAHRATLIPEAAIIYSQPDRIVNVG